MVRCDRRITVGSGGIATGCSNRSKTGRTGVLLCLVVSLGD